MDFIYRYWRALLMLVGISIHSLINQLLFYSSSYNYNDYFSQFWETVTPLLPDHLSKGPFMGFPNFSANADCSINTAG